MARKVPNDVQKVFDKYTVNFVRRLNKDKSLEMFKTEFKLDDEMAELMFDMFDTDKNGVLSIWEFHHFYVSFGYRLNGYMERFKELEEENGCGTLDVSRTWDFFQTLETMGGRTLTEEELESTMKAKMQNEKTIDKRKYLEIISRIKFIRN